MSPLLSVVIPCLDDPAIANTVTSIRETAPDVEIVIVDDCSSTNRSFTGFYGVPNVKVVHNRHRCGSGPSRHIGALYASGEWLLHTDSHMVFYPGWYEVVSEKLTCGGTTESIELGKQTVYCGTMIALDQSLANKGEYHGATLNLIGPDPGDDRKRQVFEANWLPPIITTGDIPCVMGACYLVSREWYLTLAPHRHLRSWGKEEEILSVKTWLSGGRVSLLPELKVGHIFRGPKESPPFEIPGADLLYNKLFALWTLLPFPMVEKLLPLLEKITPRQIWNRATELIRQDWHLIAAERAESRFTMSFEDFCGTFGIKIP